MLGRGVAETLRTTAPSSLFAPELVAIAREADLFVLNLECCISERGSPWPDPFKPFFFRAPPAATEALVTLGVDCVTLANNHVLDYGEEALHDTLEHLAAAGIASVGAGRDRDEARAPAVVEAGTFSLGVIGISDHPEDFAATGSRPGIAVADLWSEPMPEWLVDAVRELEADAVLVTPHWGPNMVAEPVGHVRDAAQALVGAGATLIAGHSAHVFHGVEGRILYDLGDFVDDYAIDPILRNDLGLLFLVTLSEGGPVCLEAIPLKLEYCYTRLANGDDALWVRNRFRHACAEFGTEVRVEDDRLVLVF